MHSVVCLLVLPLLAGGTVIPTNNPPNSIGAEAFEDFHTPPLAGSFHTHTKGPPGYLLGQKPSNIAIQMWISHATSNSPWKLNMKPSGLAADT